MDDAFPPYDTDLSRLIDQITVELEKPMTDMDEMIAMNELITAWKREHAPVAYLADQRDNAYRERDRLVAFLSTLYPSHLAVADDAEPGWQYVVCIHAPCGQLSWHIPDREVETIFAHLECHDNDWDGHTTEEKYDRLAGLGKVMLETRIA